MSAAALLAALSAICAVLAAWEAIAAAEQQRLVQALRRWVAPALELVRSGRAPTSPERRRLALLGALALLGGGWLVGGLLAGVALAAAAPWAARRVVHARARRRAAAVAAGVPAIARDGGVGGPAGEELRAAAAALDLGKRTEDVLRDLARRSEGGPLDTLVAAVLLQRDAGGDLAALLRDLAAALEERARVVAAARSATEQARFTALLVAALPAAGIALGELAQPGLLLALASSTLTAAMVAAALALEALAFACVRRIARIGARA